MASLRRTQYRAACRDALRYMWQNKRYGANQAHEHFKSWWKNFPKELEQALKTRLQRKIRKHKLLTKGIFNKEIKSHS